VDDVARSLPEIGLSHRGYTRRILRASGTGCQREEGEHPRQRKDSCREPSASRAMMQDRLSEGEVAESVPPARDLVQAE
jgi:hypothetical protein